MTRPHQGQVCVAFGFCLPDILFYFSVWLHEAQLQALSDTISGIVCQTFYSIFLSGCMRHNYRHCWTQFRPFSVTILGIVCQTFQFIFPSGCRAHNFVTRKYRKIIAVLQAYSPFISYSYKRIYIINPHC